MQKLHNDFGDFAKSFMDTKSRDFDICISISSITFECKLMIDSSVKLLFFYYLVTEEKNKELAARIMINKLNDDLSYLNGSIQSINSYLTLAKSPVVVATGNRLKDEIREIIGLLNSVKLP